MSAIPLRFFFLLLLPCVLLICSDAKNVSLLERFRKLILKHRRVMLKESKPSALASISQPLEHHFVHVKCKNCAGIFPCPSLFYKNVACNKKFVDSVFVMKVKPPRLYFRNPIYNATCVDFDCATEIEVRCFCKFCYHQAKHVRNWFFKTPKAVVTEVKNCCPIKKLNELSNCLLLGIQNKF